ncbi:CoA transferase [Bradyrhizobium barranii]|uniref:CaiB/BaiF CoA transferase family protein n=1 Tax=Bradyrhizobium barranii TaxID=2992140 RepID=UPI0024AFD156|nr:CoA transferase [Bradyrhizobium barranii]WFT93418.1 CoA transferase [Bradyrhizobium barranii]
MTTSGALPMLSGLKVIDITQFVAGPTASRVLAELGADVIKVELAPYGDRSRVQGVKPKEAPENAAPYSTYFFQHNHSKRGIALDFKNERAREILKGMISKADVLVENFSPGVMARAGLSYEELKRLNPGLVMCSISFAGQTGELSEKPGYDYIGQAYAGVTGMIGEADGSPALVTMAIGDVSTGMSAALAIVTALFHRERTGEGQHVESSLLDTYFHMHEASIPRVSKLGNEYVQRRTGSQHPDGGPTGIFRCGDGKYITLMSLAHQWPQLVQALELPELLDDPRFASASTRRKNNDQLKDILEGWLASVGPRDECLKRLEKRRIPVAPVLDLNDVIELDHLKSRKTVRTAIDPLLGEFKIPGMPVRFSGWQPPSRLAAARLGEHNADVLREYGLSDDEIADLHDKKIFVRDKALG